MAGLGADRAVEIIVTLPDGKRRRGSGYLVSAGRVLTAAHVVVEAAGIRVRFDADRPDERTAEAAVEWAHPGIDVAVLAVPGPNGAAGTLTPSSFGQVSERDVELRCSAIGFPRFKLRDDEDGTRYRDSEHVHATCTVLSNRREGTLDLTVTPPTTPPDPQVSPWEGMSGAAVFSSGRIIGVIGRHHLSDGPGRLAASRVDRWAEQLAPDECGQLETALGCSLSPDALPDVAPPSSPGWKILDRYAGMLRDNTRPRLTDAHRYLELDRSSARRALAQSLTVTAAGQGTLVVLGEPDVGKSALTLRAVEDLQQTVATVASVGLRDLPPSVTALDSDLGAPLAEVLQEAEAIPARLLVIDGAEAVLEGRGQLLTDLTAAALRAGFGVAAVTRTDAARAVSDALQQAAGAMDPAHSFTRPDEHEVPRLTAAERGELTQAFPSVARFGQQPRSAWLLGRPGLVDLLLRADATQVLPDGALSEADVFAAVWSRLVRRGEEAPPGGPSPDAREQAMVALARRRLLPNSTALAAPDPAALPSLRSDGLLLPAGPHRAWRPADDFASDLVRDLALARLLLTDGWGLLEAAGAPRWTLRAVRLACQATLADARPDSELARHRLQQVFDTLAGDHGDRWAELPLEAMLTLGSAAGALAAAWPALTTGEGRPGQLAMLLRLALDGHSRRGVGDPVILAPIVEFTYGTGLYPGNSDSPYTSPGVAALVRELVLAWLRGLAAADAEALPLRQQVRDVLLDVEPEGHDEFAVEAIATLGADLGTRAEGFLRALAEDGGGFLAPAVESEHVARSMSRTRPELLLSLAEAYYIKKPRTGGPWYSQPDPLDEEVRGHTRTYGAFGPMARWDFGPFFWLLAAKPTETLQMIHRLLGHAAATRVRRVGSFSSGGERSGGALEGLELDLPGAGRRLCVGDEHVWSWYRGTSVGPYPCMSALLAVEQFADYLIDRLGLPMGRVTELLLRDCGNLAMPGLVVGLLVRHLECVGTELDRWLIRPEIWHLEILRVAAEDNLHAQGPDPADITGRDRRRHSFLEAATQMTVAALLAGNQERLTVLHDLGDELLRRAGDNVFGEQVGAESSTLTMIKGRAGRLQAHNYRFVELDDGRTGLHYEPPPEVVAGLAGENAELVRGQQAIRLLMTYAVNEDRSAPLDTLAADLELAQTLAADPPLQGSLYPMDPMVGTAAAAMVAHADGHIDLAEDAIDWAAGLLLNAALYPHEDEYASMSSLHHMGADRSAAIGVPLLLLPIFATVRIDYDAVERALIRCATSLFDEVRCALPLGLARVWSAPCGIVPEPSQRRSSLARIWSALCGAGLKRGRCRHQTAWDAVEAGLRDCQRGPWDQELQRRTIEPLNGPPAEALRAVETDRLLVNRLAGPLMAAADAARSGCCIASRARHLLDTLWDAHRRGAAHWATEGYSGATLRKCHRRVARILLSTAGEGNSSPLTKHLQAFATNAPALAQLLSDLSLLCTYDADLRHTLPKVWPTVMQTVLDAIDAGADPRRDPYQGRYAIAGLIPHPQPDSGDENPSASLDMAGSDWIEPEILSPLIARWMHIACTTPEAVDALLGLIETASASWQATTGLQWINELIGDGHAAIASRCWKLPGWLERLRTSSDLRPSDRVLLQRIVDGLATHGDSRAVRLQRLDE
ncbi:trypsin-like peptidase domain-containing protein [Streptomyces sp. NPDC059881]|uniref:trypsin-like peptidase domain-containing protein n=1 Tax=Streptomyces sp. NPDC059881 TaxID=3346986 RepID=UPI003646EBD2